VSSKGLTLHISSYSLGVMAAFTCVFGSLVFFFFVRGKAIY
jgi:hypothetical protein